MPKLNLKNSVDYINLNFLPFLLFLLFPFMIIGGNLEELGIQTNLEIIQVSLAAFLLSSISLVIVYYFSPKNCKGVIYGVVTFVAFFLYFNDLILPLGFFEIENGMPEVSISASDYFLSGLIFFASLLLSRRNSVSRLITSIVVWSGVVFFLSIYLTLEVRNGVSLDRGNSDKKESKNLNIYHVVFDGYTGREFPVESVHQSDLWRGFRYFPNSYANYLSTSNSFPSFLSGTMMKTENETRYDWFLRRDANNIFKKLNSQGYTTTAYGLYPHLGYGHADEVFSRVPYTRSYILFMWLLRVSPKLFTPFINDNSILSFSQEYLNEPSGDRRTFDSYQQIMNFIDSIGERPVHNQYVFLHSFLPHAPYQFSEMGKFISGGTDYEAQVKLSNLIMDKILSKLKQLGRLEGAIVVFQSDHGNLSEKKYDVRHFSDPRVKLHDVMNYSAKEIQNRFNALLVVKPAYAKEPIVVDEGLFQLSDLSDLILSFVNSKEVVFQNHKINMLNGLKKKKNSDGEIYRTCTGKNRESITGYSLNTKNEWTQESIVVRCEP